MKIDTGLGMDLSSAGASAAASEAAGYSGISTAEMNHDPFFPLLMAAQTTESIELATGIAVAFARTPMILANIGYDLHTASKGRFVLGLGSQIKPHITKRFSMPWSSPAARMREMVLAIRAIWDCWQNGTKLEFRGDYYTHTLMTPFFSPGPNEFGLPKIQIAGVGPLMTQVAGEVCDGFIAHPFTTAEYLRDVTMPNIETGRSKSGASADGFDIKLPAFIVTGTSDEETAKVDAAVRGQIAFYGSTPAYKPVLEHHGWGDLQGELNTLSKQGEWKQMATLIDDDMLSAFAVIAEPSKVAAGLLERYDGLATRLSFNTMTATDPDMWTDVIAELTAADGGA